MKSRGRYTASCWVDEPGELIADRLVELGARRTTPRPTHIPWQWHNHLTTSDWPYFLFYLYLWYCSLSWWECSCRASFTKSAGFCRFDDACCSTLQSVTVAIFMIWCVAHTKIRWQSFSWVKIKQLLCPFPYLWVLGSLLVFITESCHTLYPHHKEINRKRKSAASQCVLLIWMAGMWVRDELSALKLQESEQICFI